jgi:hypothetical protein
MKTLRTSRQHPPKRTARLAALACAGALAMGAAQAVGAAGVAVAPLHAFTGVEVADTSAAGAGARPLSPPVLYNGKLYGVTERGGITNQGGVAYSLNAANSAAGDYTRVNLSSGTNTPQSYLGNVTGDGLGNFYLGLQSGDISRFSSTSLSPVLAGTLSAAPGSTNRGLWASHGGSVYFYKVNSSNVVLYKLDSTSGAVPAETGRWNRVSAAGQQYTPISVTASASGIYGVLSSSYGAEHPNPSLTWSRPLIYKIEGGVQSTLAEFSSQTFGGFPAAGSGTDSSGSVPVNSAIYSGIVDGGGDWLYGTTYSPTPQGTPITNGGLVQPDAKGTVYRIHKTEVDAATGFNKVEILHTFAGGTADGEGAAGSIVKAADGNIYGTARLGGANGAGTLWRIVVADVAEANKGYELLHSFAEGVDGKTPVGLSLDDSGWTLFGAAESGGTHNQGTNTSGTVFRVDLPRPAVTIDTFAAAQGSIADGEKATLSWASTHATRCEASGDWSGARQASGTEQTNALPYKAGGYSFKLVCSDDAGTKSEEKTVAVQVAAPVTPVTPADPDPVPTTPVAPGPDSGGGGGPVSGLLLAALAGLVAVRRRGAKAPR